MPLYEYQCQSCGTRVEKIQKFTDPPPDSCEACGGAMQKLPSSPAIQFKGSGWYITDYAKKTAVEGTKSPEGKSDGGKSSDSGTASDAGKSSDSSKAEPAKKDSPAGTKSDTGTSAKS